MSEMTDKKLLQDIEDAFSNLAYPGDDNIVYDNHDADPDVIDTRTDFRGKHWKELSIDIINDHRDDLSYLTSEAFCFYLPAFLIASISYPTELIDVLPDNLISRLTPRVEIPTSNAKFMAIVDILSPQQRKVVAAFLQWYTNSIFPEEIRVFDINLTKATKFWKDITQAQ
ncbi:MAG: DUF6714 family protein [Chloroflexota bacterium]